MDLMAELIRLPSWSKTGDLVRRALEAGLGQVEENWYNAKPFLMILDSFTAMVFQPEILGSTTIGADGTEAIMNVSSTVYPTSCLR
jgi:hypothetical protein